jgi:predicted glutamate--cysteine ligase
LNRVELRICDLVTSPDELLAMTAFLELRLLSLRDQRERLDPLLASSLSAEELATLSDANDAAVAHASLDADLRHWKDGQTIRCRDWIQSLIDDVTPLAAQLNLESVLTPLHTVLKDGNQAMRWAAAHSKGETIPRLLQNAIEEMKEQELQHPTALLSLG